jgi:GntR family transcriptional repressor for pyruvate dehydrogenase complex
VETLTNPTANADSVSPPQRPNLSSYLSQQVLNLIAEKNLRPGDRLPPARNLAAQFGVATPTMREALRRLQATGVLDIKHGSGIYVRRDRERLMLSNPGSGVLETHTILQVLDARLLIEPHLAALAAEHATETEIVEVAALLEHAEATLARTDDAYLRANHLFHTAIARASGNLVLTHVVESLIELYSTELHLVDPTRTLVEIRARDHQRHQLVFAAIRDRDAARAGEAMRAHIALARTTVTPKLV